MTDLRIPIGLFFSIVGVILIAGPRAPVNFYSGCSMLVFGGAMLWLARRRS